MSITKFFLWNWKGVSAVLNFKVAIWSCVEVLFFCNEGNILLSCWSDLIWMKIPCNSNWFIEQSPSYILRLVFSVFALKYTKITGNTRKIRLFTCLWIIYKTEIFFSGIIGFFIPKNICIDTKFVTLTALEPKLWHKTWFPNFNGGHFEMA